jgi:hypothetical protein
VLQRNVDWVAFAPKSSFAKTGLAVIFHCRVGARSGDGLSPHNKAFEAEGFWEQPRFLAGEIAARKRENDD